MTEIDYETAFIHLNYDMVEQKAEANNVLLYLDSLVSDAIDAILCAKETEGDPAERLLGVAERRLAVVRKKIADCKLKGT